MTEPEHDDIDWQAWQVDDLPESFADDVLDAIDRGAPVDDAEVVTPATASPSPARLGWGIAIAAGAFAAAAAVALWVATRPDEASPSDETPVAAYDGVGVTEEDESAKWRWVSASERSAVAEQTAGRVRWDAERGVALTVQTPAGRVTTTRAAFSLEVLQMSKSKLPLFAGAAVAGTVAAVVYMHSGTAELSNAEGTAEADAPRTAVMTDRSAPHSLSESTAKPKTAVQSVIETPKIDWEKAKAGIEAALYRRHPEVAAPPAADDAPIERDHEGESFGTLSKEYIRDTVKEEVVPLVKECYDNLLFKDPDISGRMVLQFTIMGDESVGGIVDEMDFGEGSEIQDEDFRECLSQTMMSTVFEPPEGGGKVVVHYPFVFASDVDEAMKHTPGNDAPVSGDPAEDAPDEGRP